MKENVVEKCLVFEVEKRGGLALKTDLIPGFRGFPDRTVLLPGGKVYFIELKRPGKKPRNQQALKISWLVRLGFNAFTIDTLEGVEKFFKEVDRCGS